MPRIIRLAQAEQDLLDIWLYTLMGWGEQLADDFLAELEEVAASQQVSR